MERGALTGDGFAQEQRVHGEREVTGFGGEALTGAHRVVGLDQRLERLVQDVHRVEPEWVGGTSWPPS